MFFKVLSEVSFSNFAFSNAFIFRDVMFVMSFFQMFRKPMYKNFLNNRSFFLYSDALSGHF